MAEQEDEGRYGRALAIVHELLALSERVSANLDGALQANRQLIQHLENDAHETPVEAPVQRPVQPSQHLREHRPGRPKKLAADPELRAFVEARFNRMTFEQIADEVAQNFPPERRVAKSAIHAWWHAHYKRK